MVGLVFFFTKNFLFSIIFGIFALPIIVLDSFGTVRENSLGRDGFL